jgi:hypothetical protein
MKDYPFKDHEKVYHEFSAELLLQLYEELVGIKENYVMRLWKNVPRGNILV